MSLPPDRRESPTAHRLTRRTGWLLGGTLLLGQVSWASGNGWFLVLAGACLGLLVAGLLDRARLDGLDVGVRHPTRSTVGEQVPCQVTVTNRGRQASSEATVQVTTHGLSDLVVAVGRLAPGGSVTLEAGRQAVARAAVDASLVHLSARPSIGVWCATRALLRADRVVVHPWLPALTARRSTVVRREDDDGRVVPGAGPEVLGLRQWRAGDDLARVSWRATARTGHPVLLERGSVEADELRVVLVGPDRSALFEEALAAAAATVDDALARGAVVQVVAWHVSGPVLADASTRPGLLDWWSAVHDVPLPEPRTFGATLLAGLGQGEVLVAAPAGTSGEWLPVAQQACPGLVLVPLRARS